MTLNLSYDVCRIRTIRVLLLFLGLFAATLTNRAVVIAWDPNTEPDVAGYNVYYAPSGGTYQKLNVGNQTSVTINTLSAGVNYSFYATAYNTAGMESEPSEKIFYTVPSALQLSWEASGLAATAGYYVYFGESDALPQKYDAANRTSWTFNDAIPGKNYRFYVAAYSSTGAEIAVYAEMTTTVAEGKDTTVLTLTKPKINPTATASFVQVDTATLGDWKGKYGAEGMMVLGDYSRYPADMFISCSGKGYVSWENPSTDPSALQKVIRSERIAAAWYGSLTLKMPFTDTRVHRVSLYCIDYENSGLEQAIDVRDMETGTLLATHTISNFHDGVYVSFDVEGRVDVQLRRMVGKNYPVVSGVFIDDPNTAPLKSPITLAWDVSSAPAVAGYNFYYGEAGGTMQKIDVGTATSLTVSDLITGGNYAFKVAAYNTAGTEIETYPTVTSIAGSTSNLILERPVETISAAFVTLDRTTGGSWKEKYGSEGYMILGDYSRYPSDMFVSCTGKGYVNWENPSTDSSAPEKVLKSERVAAAWYGALTLKMPWPDNMVHRVSLYCLDFENRGLQQYVEILNLETGSVIASQFISGFQDGVYVTFDVRGNVGVRLRRVGTDHPVVSAIFFDTPPAEVL